MTGQRDIPGYCRDMSGDQTGTDRDTHYISVSRCPDADLIGGGGGLIPGSFAMLDRSSNEFFTRLNYSFEEYPLS